MLCDKQGIAKGTATAAWQLWRLQRDPSVSSLLTRRAVNQQSLQQAARRQELPAGGNTFRRLQAKKNTRSPAHQYGTEGDG